MPQRFTLAEAESLIPLLERLLGEAVTMKAEYEEAEQILQSLSARVAMMGGTRVNRNQAIDARGRREVAGARLRRAMEQIRETGCLVKDLDIGLVDFPALRRGVEVCLCWKLGERSIGHWHGMDEGFRGRKPIGRDFRGPRRGAPEQ
jgi:hypothetical protein